MNLLSEAAIFLAAAVVTVPLFRRFKLSAVLGYLAAGVLIGPFGLKFVSAVDNVLRPLLLSERSEINGLLLLIGLLGGVIAFGGVGLVLGPVLMATAVGLFKAFTVDGELPSRSL